MKQAPDEQISAGLQAERYKRRVRLYNRVGTVYLSTALVAVVLVFVITIAWKLSSRGVPWSDDGWESTAMAIVLFPAAPVVLVGKLVRMFWWPALEWERDNLNRRIAAAVPAPAPPAKP